MYNKKTACASGLTLFNCQTPEYKKRDFIHLLFNADHADRILQFPDIVAEL